jgi:siroheme synthase
MTLRTLRTLQIANRVFVDQNVHIKLFALYSRQKSIQGIQGIQGIQNIKSSHVKCAAHTREVAHNNIVYSFKIVEFEK